MTFDTFGKASIPHPSHDPGTDFSQYLHQFGGIISASTDGLALINPDYTYRLVNQTYLYWRQKLWDDVVNHSLDEIMGEEVFHRMVKPYLDRCLAGESVRHEAWFDYAALGRRFVRMIYTPYIEPDGIISGVLATTHDLTELKTTEAALQASEAKYRSIFENAVVGIFQTTPAGTYLTVNPTLARMHGYDAPAEMIACLNDLDRQLYVQPDRRQEFIQIIHSQGWVTDFESEVYRRDGSRFWISETARAVRDEQGQLLYYEGTSLDITARKQTEVTLRQQAERERLVYTITQHIRQSFDLEEILATTVTEVRELLDSDRVLIFQLWADGSGTVVKEAVTPGYPIIMGQEITDTCFRESYIDLYRQGRVAIVADIEQAELQECHQEFLRQFRVRANLVVPILQQEHLWGLLIAHQCSQPRSWTELEVELLQQLANQVGIALIQSQLVTALQESEQSYRTLAHNLPAIVYRFFPETRQAQFFNTMLEGILGFRAEELPPGRLCPIEALVLEEDHLQVMATVQPAIAHHQPFQIEYRVRDRNGQIHYLWEQGRPVVGEPGSPLSIDGIIFDITERTRLAIERQQAEDKIKEQAALLEITTDAILVRDLQQKILFWNRGAEQLYGWTAAEAMGQDATRLLYKQFTQDVSEAITAVIEQGQWQGELHQITKTGEDIIVEGRWTLVRDPEGQPQSILTVATDITEKKQLEAQFLRAQRLESLGTLAGGIAHDLNNLLTPILIAAQLLQHKLPDDSHLELLDILETNARRGADLVKQVLAFARGVEGRRAPLQPSHLLKEIAQVAKSTFPKSIRIQINVPTENLWLVAANVTQLHQVLMNLCVNARDAMLEGGTLTLSVENQWVDEAYARTHLDASPGAYVLITVSDTGSGIPPEHRERIFEPFFTTKAIGKGTGLGLSTALGIVRSHGGFVNVESQLGEGSRFQIYLPATATALSTPLTASNLPSGEGELILVVDDEVDLRHLTQRILNSHGYRTLIAQDGNEAIALYTNHREEIRIVLLDMVMPVKDGPAVIQALQVLGCQVPVIATSGLSANPEVTNNHLVKAFLSKPFAAEALLRTLAGVLRPE